MKEKSSSSSQENSSGASPESLSTGAAASAATTAAAATTATTTAATNPAPNSSSSSSSSSASSSSSYTPSNVLSPYDRNNFMAPPIGGIVKCVTCLGNTVQGKVMAYDNPTRMLALRSPVANKPGFFDYSMVNLAWCSNLEVIEEPTESPEPITHLNHNKLEKRKKLNIENKYKEINSLGTDVTPFAQNLYFTIYKTLNEVEWDTKNIIVMNSVVITPPYDVQSCYDRNSENSRALEHVKKIVKKFNEEYIPETQKQSQDIASK